MFKNLIEKARDIGYEAAEVPGHVICEASGEWSELSKKSPVAMIGDAIIFSDDPDGHCRAFFVFGGTEEEVKDAKKLIFDEFFRKG